MIDTYSLNSGTPFAIDAHEAEALHAGASSHVVVWINLVDPTPEECASVGSRYGIPGEHMSAALDPNERPRIEAAEDILLIVIRTPFNVAGLGHTCPLAVIATHDAVITICLKPGVAAGLLCRKILGQGEDFAERLVLSLLLRVSTSFIDELRKMDDYVDAMEQALLQSMHNRELVKMLHMEKSLVYFLTALKGNQSVLDKIHSTRMLTKNGDDKRLFEKVLIENKQATDMAEIFTEILGSISDAFGAIVSNNLNKVMKVLTGLTIVFMIPSIIGALYGMNVALPLSDNPYAFTILCLVCLGISVFVFWLLRKKNWM